MSRRGLAVAAIMCLFLAFCAPSTRGAPRNEPTRLVLNLPALTLRVYQGERELYSYPVAIGKPATPTPVGEFTLVTKQVDPWWIPEPGAAPVPPGPANPLGTRWMGLDLPLYGIHGTISPSSIGRAVSKGCVRMRNEDVESLFRRVQVGTEVSIRYDRLEVKGAFGIPTLTLYPDVYDRQPLSAGDIALVLLESGFWLPPPALLQEILASPASEAKAYVLRHRNSCSLVALGSTPWSWHGGIAFSAENPLRDEGNIPAVQASSNSWTPQVALVRASDGREGAPCGRRTRFSSEGRGRESPAPFHSWFPRMRNASTTWHSG
ncbi:MAG: L,D-transpeptidase [Bacillota bacterium]